MTSLLQQAGEVQIYTCDSYIMKLHHKAISELDRGMQEVHRVPEGVLLYATKSYITVVHVLFVTTRCYLSFLENVESQQS